MLARLICSVFRSMRQKYTLPKKLLKFSQPTHGLLKYPSAGLKSWNAIVIPYIGKYAKSM